MSRKVKIGTGRSEAGRSASLVIGLGLLVLVLAGWLVMDAGSTGTVNVPLDIPHQSDWTLLLTGTSDGWELIDFGGDGECEFRDDELIVEAGVTLSGVRYVGDIPRRNYEIALEAKRIIGSDFFCGLTFPVGETCCTLIVGGWGGSLVGLSSIDGQDAAHNDTTTYASFTADSWYPIRLRVVDERIQAWVDGELLIDQPIAGRALSVRIDVELSQPFALMTYQTTAAFRNVRIRTVD